MDESVLALTVPCLPSLQSLSWSAYVVTAPNNSAAETTDVIDNFFMGSGLQPLCQTAEKEQTSDFRFGKESRRSAMQESARYRVAIQAS